MTTQEELVARRAEWAALVRKARTTATRFGIIAVVALIALVYAFFQQTQAKYAMLLAETNRQEVLDGSKRMEEDLSHCKREVEIARDQLTKCQNQ